MGNVALAGSDNLVKAVSYRWRSSGLDDHFRAYRSNVNPNVRVLFGGEAKPTTPLPYCVFEQTSTQVVNRMAGDRSDEKFHHIESSYQFGVHAQTKRSASELAHLIMEAFSYPEMRFPDGDHVSTQYESDLCVRDGENNQWLWVIRYSTVFSSRVFIGSM